MKVLRLTLIRLAYCVCRQAERSIDYAIRANDGLAQLRSYYRGERNDFLTEVLQCIGPGNYGKNVTSPPSFSLLSFLIRIFLLPIGAVMGWRWCSRAEVIWLTSSLEEFHQLLLASDSRSVDELVRLRMRMYACQQILEGECVLKGDLRSLGRQIEHLGQSDFLEFASISVLLMKRE